MAVAVFGQLDHVLRERDMTLDDLKRLIEERDGEAADDMVLDQLASGVKLPRIDLAPVGVVASILRVPLDDLLLVVHVPRFRSTTVNFLSEDETWRLWALMSLQERRELSDVERRELASIIDVGNQRSDESFWRQEAQRRGVPFEALRGEYEEDRRAVKAMKHRVWSDAVLGSEATAGRAEGSSVPASR